ncbi:hypothetical protein [Desulfosporosinus sp. SB140]|uniref:hypothetical protein n=1 Tax=Desulfosporosinus paludis TaxID=3115649 RepID=UPI00388E1CC4
MSEMKGLDKLIMESQQKLGAIYHRYRQLERDCEYFIYRYSEDAEEIRSLKQILANRTLNYELRLHLKIKLDSMVNTQKQQLQKYARQKRLLPKIQVNIRSVDKLRIDQENVKKLMVEAERSKFDKKSAQNYDKQFRAGLKKIDDQLNYYWNATKSNEFTV